MKTPYDGSAGHVEVGALGRAFYSFCDRYRFALERGPGDLDAPLIAFCMLNPSTATHDADDPTIRKCRKFAARFAEERGLATHRVSIVNLFAFRATDPDDCFAASAPVGWPTNDAVIRAVMKEATIAICAWGSDKRSLGRASEVMRILRGDGVRLMRLGKTSKNGSPQHPLYLKDSTALEPHGGT